MEAPLHQSPVPLPPPPQDDAADVGAPALLLHHQAAAARAMAMAMAAAAHQKPPAPAAMGREQCPRCASRDTKFCYYNNYNTAQPRHFCRACRRYWTLGGSLRNVPVGGSTRKRPRPARPYTSRAIAAATTTSSPFLASSSAAAAPSLQAGGLLASLLLLGAASPLLALGAAPLLEGRPGPDLGLEQPAAPLLAGAADLEPPQLGFSAGPPPQPLWPPATTVLLEEWKSGGALRFPLPPGAALWQDLSAAAAAAPPVEAGGLMRHGASPHLLL